LNNHIEATIDQVRALHPEAIESVMNFREEPTLIVDATHLLDVCNLLRFDSGLDYSLLVDIAFVDHYPNEPRFSLSYILHSLEKNARIRLRVQLSGKSPEVSSVTACWKSAEWPEREAFDMMGINFVGHPDLRRILMPADWDGHPLRKDYPLGYEEVQFSFNWEEIDSKKDYAKE